MQATAMWVEVSQRESTIVASGSGGNGGGGEEECIDGWGVSNPIDTLKKMMDDG